LSASITEYLINFGALGVVVVLLVIGELVPGFAHRATERALEKSEKALEVERQRNADLQLTAMMGTKAMTALTQIAEDRRATETQ